MARRKDDIRNPPEDPDKPRKDNIRRVPKDSNVKARYYEAEVVLGRHPDGRKIRKSRRFALEGQAKKWQAEQKEAQAGSAAVVEPTRATLAAYLERWLEDVAKIKVRPVTFADYRATLQRYVVDPPAGAPPLGGTRVDRLTTEAVQAHYGWLLRDRGLSPRSVRGHHAVLHQALKHAVRTGTLRSNPAAAVTLPKAERPEIQAMTREEAARFLSAAQTDRLAALWVLLLAGGLRPGEAFGLKWSDLDSEGARIRVRRSLTRRGVEGWRLMDPKTRAGRRSVTLPELAVQALGEHRRRQVAERLKAGPKWQDDDFIFCTPAGAPLDLTNVRRNHFNPTLQRAGLGSPGPDPVKPRRGPTPRRKFIPGFNIYSLRHTCATLLLLAGENPKVVQERLGHASVSLTLDTYSHVLPSMQEGAASKLQALLQEEPLAEGAGG